MSQTMSQALPQFETRSAPEPAVICRSVRKSFGGGTEATPVLRGVDLTVPSGALTMLVGPSGCGKTTLLSIIAGILRPDAGEVIVGGIRVGCLSEADKAAFRTLEIGFVFQQYNLLPALTAAENAAVPLVIAGQPMRVAVREAVVVLDRLGMAAHARKRPRELSGGQQQRVAIARALVHRPRLIVCDEPTAALDAERGEAVVDLFRQVSVEAGRAVVVVTHDTRILHHADAIAHMEDGRVTRVEGQATCACPPATEEIAA